MNPRRLERVHVLKTMKFGFGRFIGLNDEDAPQLLARQSKQDLGVDGERYGISTRLIARPGVSVADLAIAAVRKSISLRIADDRELARWCCRAGLSMLTNRLRTWLIDSDWIVRLTASNVRAVVSPPPPR